MERLISTLGGAAGNTSAMSIRGRQSFATHVIIRSASPNRWFDPSFSGHVPDVQSHNHGDLGAAPPWRRRIGSWVSQNSGVQPSTPLPGEKDLIRTPTVTSEILAAASQSSVPGRTQETPWYTVSRNQLMVDLARRPPHSTMRRLPSGAVSRFLRFRDCTIVSKFRYRATSGAARSRPSASRATTDHRNRATASASRLRSRVVTFTWERFVAVQASDAFEMG